MNEELKCAFTGKAFWISAAVMAVCYLSFSIPSWVGSVDWGTEFRPSALQQGLEAIEFGGVIFLLPFCAGGAYATSQVDEIQSNFFLLKVVRSSYVVYGRNKIIASMLSGAAVVSVVFALHSLAWNGISLPYDPTTYPYHELPFRSDGFYFQWHLVAHALPIYLYVTVTIGLFGAMWAVVALALSVWIDDKLLAATIPACLCKLWASNIYKPLLGWGLPTASTLFGIEINTTLFGQSLVMYAVHIALAITLYMLGLKRRVQHA